MSHLDKNVAFRQLILIALVFAFGNCLSQPETQMTAKQLSFLGSGALLMRAITGLPDWQIYVFAPCGIVAGLMARTDTTHGVWKAAAGLDAAMNGIQGLEVNWNDGENGILNPTGINCLRQLAQLCATAECQHNGLIRKLH